MESAQAADPQPFGSKMQQFQKLAENRSERIRLIGPYPLKRRAQQASAAVVNSAVTSCAEGNQIEFTIIAGLATRLEMMDMKLSSPATVLASPLVSP